MPASGGRGMQLHHRLVYVNTLKGRSNHWYHFSAGFLTMSRRHKTPQLHQNAENSAGAMSSIHDGRNHIRSRSQMNPKTVSEGCGFSVV